eukprot:m.108729 g.108729  ORF g.108729 m.108729 type:complete len:287 (-) comp12819_c0_seq1:45-905(-)
MPFGGVSKALKKAGGDIAREGKKAGGDIAAEAKRFGKRVSDEGKRVAEDCRREVEHAINHELKNAVLELTNVVKNLPAELKSKGHAFLKAQHQAIERLSRDLSAKALAELEESVKAMVMALIPGLNAARLAALAKGIATAFRNFAELKAKWKAFEHSITRGGHKLYCFVRDDASDQLAAMRRNANNMFRPFVEDPSASLINFKSLVKPADQFVDKIFTTALDMFSKLSKEAREIDEAKAEAGEFQKMLADIPAAVMQKANAELIRCVDEMMDTVVYKSTLVAAGLA